MSGGGEYPQAMRVLARLLIEYRDNAEAVAIRLTDHARRTGQDFDRRADEARGASGAYSIAIAALVGSLGARSIDDIAAEPIHRDMQRPTLPVELTEPERTTEVAGIVVLRDADESTGRDDD